MYTNTREQKLFSASLESLSSRILHWMDRALFVAAVLLIISTLLVIYRKNIGIKQLPPGPKPQLLFGNALQLPKLRPWIRLGEWSSIYGDVVFMRVFRRPFVTLSSHEAITDLIERRSANYSRRPIRNMAQLCGFGKALLFQSHAETVRQSRKLMYSEFTQRGVLKHRGLQQIEARRMALRALDGTLSLIDNLRLTAAASLLEITYGYHIKDVNDPLLGMAEEVMSNLAEVITPNKFLVDAVSLLKYLPSWLPGCGFKRKAHSCKHLLEQFMERPFAGVMRDIKEGNARPSFISDILEKSSDSINEMDMDLLKWTAGGIYAAGSDTTISVLSSFFLTMILYPDVQLKAQQEIDRVVGVDSLPSFIDRDQLPYIEAVLQEVLRWNPAAPLISRSMVHNDEYKGLHIPAESVVMINIWSLMHDEVVYPNPSAFDPERFIPGEKKSAVPPDPRSFVFGFGRRSCPGIHLADALIYIIVVTTLAVFNIEPGQDENGAPIYPKVEYSTGAVSHPAPFECRLRPRSLNAVKLVKDAVE